MGQSERQAPALEIRVLGELEVLHEGRSLPLPPSRKTRALLAQLAVSGRPFLRTRLCDIYWDIPDDPRAALRWSLNKIRPLVNTDDSLRLVADRERVALELRPDELDLAGVRAALAGGIAQQTTETLRRVADSFRGEFLEGLDLLDCPRYEEWCRAERDELRALLAALLAELIERTKSSPIECLRYARRRVAVDPYAEEAHACLVRLLGALGRRREALEQYDDCRRLLEQELGTRPSAELERARADAVAGAPHVPAEAHPAAAAPAPEPPLSRATLLVGRARELEEIVRTVRAAAQRKARGVLLVAGEPGIGKTRLLEELADRVRAAGGAVLGSRGFEAEMVRPYGVWIDALRSAPKTAAPPVTDLAALLPELSKGSASVPVAEQAQIFDAVRRHVANLSVRASPAAIVIDDLHSPITA